MAELEGLSFSVTGNGIESSASSLDKLTASLNKLTAVVNKGSFKTASDGINKLNTKIASIDLGKITKLADALSELGKMKDIDIKVNATTASKVADTVAKAAEASVKTGSANTATSTATDDRQDKNLGQMPNNNRLAFFEKLSSLGSKAAIAVAAVGTAVKSTVSTLGMFSSVTGITSDIDSFLTSISQSGTVFAPFASGLQQTASAINKIYSSNLNSISKAFLSIASAATIAYKSVLNLVAMPVHNFISKIQNMKSTWDQFLSSIGRIAVYRAVRSAIKAVTSGFQTGIDAMYQWALVANNTFAPSMDSIATSTQYMQNSLAAAVAPIINALAPAVQFLTNCFVQLLNVMNQVFAFLGGSTTWTKAVRTTKKYAAAVGGTGTAAKKADKDLKNYTLSIDELHVIQKEDTTDSGSGGSGGSGTPDYGSMFTQEPISDDIKKWLNTNNWSELGAMIADKMNEAMANIPWDAIDKTERTWATRIFTLINGFIGELDWSLLGYTLGRGLNVALHFLDTLAQGINFTELGKDIGTALQSMCDTIDWRSLGRVLTDGLRIALELLHGFVTSDFDWDSLRTDIQSSIKAAFENIDLVQGAIDVSKLAIEILDTITAAIDAIDWTKVSEALKAIDWAGIIDAALKLLWSVITNLSESGLGDVVFPALGVAVGAQIGSLFGGPLGAAIGAGIGLLLGVVVDKLPQIVNFIETAWTDIQNFTEQVWNVIGPFVTTIWNGILAVAEFVFDLIKGFITGDWTDVQNDTQQIWDAIKTFAEGIWNGLVAKVTAVWESIKAKIQEKWLEIKGNTTLVWNAVKTFITGLWDNLTSKVQSTWEGFKSTISNKWNDIKSGTENIWNNIHTGLKNTWENLKSTASTKFENIKTKISDVWNQTKTNSNGSWSIIYDTLTSKWGDFKSAASDKFNDVKNTISDVFNGIISSVFGWGSDMLNGFVNGIKSVWDSFKNTISDIANTVSSFLHFSRPDEGPLRDYEQWMPDMMRGLASGIRDNEWMVTDALDDLTYKMNLATEDAAAISVPDMSLATGGYNFSSNTSVDNSTDLKGAMVDAIQEQLLPFIKDITANTKTSAEKPNTFNVSIGNKDIKDAVTTQNKADGYSFTD